MKKLLKKILSQRVPPPQCTHFRAKGIPVLSFKVLCPDCGQLVEIKK